MDLNELEKSVANIVDGETPADSTSVETPSEEKTEQTHTEESSEDTTSLKSEEETEETKKEEEETRFDKHPRWQKLKQERDSYAERARRADELETKLQGLSAEEIQRLGNASQLLRKYPELAEKVQKIIDNYSYGSEETKTAIQEIRQEHQELRNEIILERYDKTVDKLITDNKVDSDIVPLVKELLDTRVINLKLDLKEIPIELNKIIKQVETIRRKVLSSHIQDKNKETKIPVSTLQKGKVIAQKSESAEETDIIAEITAGLKADRGGLLKE